MNPAIVFPPLAAVAVLLVFLGLSQALRPQVDVSERLGWGRPQNKSGPKSNLDEAQRGLITRQMDKAVANKDFATNIARDLARADLKLTVSEYLIIRALAVLALFAIGTLVSSNPIAGLLLGAIGLYIPPTYVGMKQQQRLKAFSNQLPDTLSLLVNSLRSGLSLLQSMEMVSREAPQPTRDEFQRVVREVGLGLAPEAALHNLVRRINSEELDLVVTAINVQHEVGGNLAQILDTIAATIRDRVKLKGEVSVLTSQQRLSGYVISVLPIGLAVILFLLNPAYMMKLFSMEQVVCMPMIGMPICSGVMMLAGFLIMRKIVDIKI